MSNELTHADVVLIAAALGKRKEAYAPYSKFLVGAAVCTIDGQIFSGCNIENASYGLTICAERVAIASAVAAGYREFDTLLIATSGGHPPCGACRQFAAEFGDMRVVLYDVDQLTDNKPEELHDVTVYRLSELLPSGFRL